LINPKSLLLIGTWQKNHPYLQAILWKTGKTLPIHQLEFLVSLVLTPNQFASTAGSAELFEPVVFINSPFGNAKIYSFGD